jgi:7-cyano-7-deazaguanine synthase
MSKALVILSGGQDSTTCLYWAQQRFDSVEAITFDYGQRHAVELECARRLCELTRTPQKIVKMDFVSQLSANALTDSKVAVAKSGGFQDLPSTFVPGRNILFLTLAASYAAPRGIQDLVMGVCQTDYSGYPDCREDFVASMEASLQKGLGAKIVVHRPLMHLSKAETFRMASELGRLKEVVELSHTCYEGRREVLHAWGYGCGECPACELRRRGFEEYAKENSNHG